MPQCNVSHQIQNLLINPIEKFIVINYAKCFDIESGETFAQTEPNIVLKEEDYEQLTSLTVTFKGKKCSLEELLTGLTIKAVKKANKEALLPDQPEEEETNDATT